MVRVALPDSHVLWGGLHPAEHQGLVEFLKHTRTADSTRPAPGGQEVLLFTFLRYPGSWGEGELEDILFWLSYFSMKWEGRPSTEGEDGGGCQRPESREDIIVAGQGNARSIKGFLKLVTMKWDTQQDCDFLQPCSAPWAVLRVGGESSLNRIGFCQTMMQEVWILAWIQFSSYMTSMAQRLTFYICKTGKMSVPTPEKLVVKFKWISRYQVLRQHSGCYTSFSPLSQSQHAVVPDFVFLHCSLGTCMRWARGSEK